MRRLSTWHEEGSLFVAAMLTCFSAAACSMRVEGTAGNRPNLELLETSLRLGESRGADVRAALGEPLGQGKAMLPTVPERGAMTTWSYYYEEGSLEDARRMFLFVFFDHDIYGGYMWFSSLPK